jgi:hypothetical protein
LAAANIYLNMQINENTFASFISPRGFGSLVIRGGPHRAARAQRHGTLVEPQRQVQAAPPLPRH